MNRWTREFRRANNVRLEELGKYFSSDPSYDPARRAAAEAEIDVLEAPQVAAEHAWYVLRMAELERLTAQLMKAEAHGWRLLLLGVLRERARR